MTDPAEGGGVPHDYDTIWATVYGDMQRHGPVHRHAQRMTRQFLRELDYTSVLDVGCGPGHNYSLLTGAAAVEHFAGVDISARALDEARRVLPGRDFFLSDIQTTHPPGRWDLVHCSFVLEHLPDDLGALRNMRAVTGRYLLAATIAGDFDRHHRWEDMVGHVRNYRRGELEEKLDACGFTVRRAVYWGWPFYSPLVRTLQDRSDLGTGSYSRVTRLIASVTYGLYFANSSRRGDVLFVLAEPLP